MEKECTLWAFTKSRKNRKIENRKFIEKLAMISDLMMSVCCNGDDTAGSVGRKLREPSLRTG